MARIGATIQVKGIVQGVGFRPFIHKQITDHSLCGYICNTSRGVEIEIEGEKERVDRFIEELWTRAPALALVQEVEPHFYTELKHYTEFRILESRALPHKDALISPDVALCEDCRRELLNPEDRRYGYPFINCTNCGPRYTIVKDLPYDRSRTSMASFPMCSPCETEYHTITDRRYHAQPSCCPDCGPQLEYRRAGAGSDTPGEKNAGVLKKQEAFAAAVWLLQEGGVLAVKGLGGFHLAARADIPEPAERLRSRKERSRKPFALMLRDLKSVRQFCELSPQEEKLLNSREKPIVLLRKKTPEVMPFISENERLGVMLPYTPLHELLLKDGPAALIMTSANPADCPIIKDNSEALARLSGLADGFLLHNRDIVARCDDSLVWELEGYPYFSRRSRGYAPRPLTLPENSEATPRLLALGAEQKGGFALLKEDKAFLSPYIGDMKNGEILLHFEETIRRYESLFDCKPEALICDLHPDYASTLYGEELAAREGIPLIRVQHHHAHLAAAMADRGLKGPVLGLIWDGSGYGEDQTVWGGEFLLGDESGFKRAASLRPFRLPGGDLCAKEIWRAGLSLLADAEEYRSGGKAPGCEDIRQLFPLSPDHPDTEMVLSQLKAGIHTPLCSSMGRLFDGISALLGICREADYEGRGAILLESAADKNEAGLLPYDILRNDADGRLLFDERPLVCAMMKLLKEGASPSRLAARFMNSLTDMSLEICCRIREESGVNRIVLSGGSFQNMYILTRLLPRLRDSGFEAFTHRRVSCSDEGIPLGQLLIGRARLSKGNEV